jgi:hypothetical protein
MFGTKLFKRGSLRIKNRKDADSPPRIIAWYLALRPETGEKTFTDCVIDLKELIVLDGVFIQPNNSGSRIRCYDLYGPLPEIVIKDSGDTFLDKDQLGNQTLDMWRGSLGIPARLLP